jgi:ubiquinone/menaquinone biosynthesis C-methylase UbiE
VPDAIFAEPRLAQIYDAVDDDRSDLDAYLTMAGEFGAQRVLDVGCGTGTLACLLAARGLEVTGADPAAASLDIARRKPHADKVRWLHIPAAHLPATLEADLAFMTGNVAQVFVTDQDWAAALTAARHALRPGGRLVFETRDPARQAWRQWTRDETYRRLVIAGTGPVETWTELVEADADRVSFHTTFIFKNDAAVLTSQSTLRFRDRDELTASLTTAGLLVDEVRDAPDRPGLEFVFIARRED